DTVVDMLGRSIVYADGYMHSNNTVIVEDRAVLTNANIYVGAYYSGSLNESLFVRSGARVYGGVWLGTGGGSADNSINGLVHVNGEDSLIDLMNSEFRIGTRNSTGLTGMCHTVRVDNRGTITNAGIRIGYCYDVGYTSRDNTLIAESGGRVFSSRETYIGAHYQYSDLQTFSHGNKVVVTGEGSFWEHAPGYGIYIGYVQNEWPSCYLYENELRVGFGGIVRGAPNINVGSAFGYSVSNRVTCAGGEISCGKFTLFTGNFLAAHITADGLPEVSVDVAGTAEFKPGTFVLPSADKDAPYGRFVLLRAVNEIDQADRENLQLASGIYTAPWKLQVTAHEVILTHAHPSTLLMVK
ncbi:MAG: hypothetical protein FWG05_05920, partial [Kiritimatiellaeota bacterium]|nr:hypothetical protein [Kiritimatiellota bacterium]